MNPARANIPQLMEENALQDVSILKLFVPLFLLLNALRVVKLEKYLIRKKVVLLLLDVLNI